MSQTARTEPRPPLPIGNLAIGIGNIGTLATIPRLPLRSLQLKTSAEMNRQRAHRVLDFAHHEHHADSLRAKEALCADGRMLFLSLWPPQPSRPDNATLHRRCHEMGDLILTAKT